MGLKFLKEHDLLLVWQVDASQPENTGKLQAIKPLFNTCKIDSIFECN